jgi:hypothetical protein
MYYHLYRRQLIVDGFDYFLFSLYIFFHVTNYLKFRLSEEEKMKRLRQDLINRSKMVKSSSKTMTLSSSTKVQKIAKFALRGGNDEFQDFQELREVYDMLESASEKIRMTITHLLMMINDRPKDNKILNFIFGGCRAYLHLILSIWKVNLTYLIDPITGKTIVATVISGGVIGVVSGVWFAIAGTILLNGISTIWISRSIFQQANNALEYRNLRNQVKNLLKDREIKEEIQKTFFDIAEQYEENKLKLKPFSWEEKTRLKEAAKRLVILEENLSSRPIQSTQESLYIDYVEKGEKIVEKVVEKMKNINLDPDIIEMTN